MDHRWGRREPVAADVRLACCTCVAATGRLDNVSMSGAFVRTSARPPLLSQVRVIAYLRCLDGPRQRYEADACVVRHSDAGIGIEWLELSPVLFRVLINDLSLLSGTLEQPRHLPAPSMASIP